MTALERCPRHHLKSATTRDKCGTYFSEPDLGIFFRPLHPTPPLSALLTCLFLAKTLTGVRLIRFVPQVRHLILLQGSIAGVSPQGAMKTKTTSARHRRNRGGERTRGSRLQHRHCRDSPCNGTSGCSLLWPFIDVHQLARRRWKWMKELQRGKPEVPLPELSQQ